MALRQHARCSLFTASGAHSLALRTADNFLKRFRGLMLRPPLGPSEGMLLTHCASVHTAFMRSPIDIVYLDRNGVVTRCVPHLRPWRASSSSGPHFPRAAHTLELACGAIAAFGIAPGDRLGHPYWEQGAPASVRRRECQRGSAMIEFAVVGPLIALLGLGTLQYGMLFFAKNQVNYATFIAGREGAVARADLGAVQQAYVRALAPLYGGGETAAEVAQSVAKASADMAGNLSIEMLNPTKESFSDWNDPALQTQLKTGSKRVIPNDALAARLNQSDKQGVGSASGQSLQDANMLKLKVTHGYLPKIPVVGKLYIEYLKLADSHADTFQTKLINEGRIPVVTHVTIAMQSNAIEPDSPVSMRGPGDGGTPADPGRPPVSQDPPSPAPDPPPECNPFTDPNHCQQPECVPSSQMCCMPRQ